MTPTFVEDAELLYRSVRANSDEYKVQDGKIFISTSAFADRNLRPSVDRSSMRERPEDARLNATDGVTALITSEVRSIRNLRVKPDDPKDAAVYEIDAKHDPKLRTDTQPENLAHCMILCTPDVTKNHFNKRVKEALAIIATKHGFIVKPT